MTKLATNSQQMFDDMVGKASNEEIIALFAAAILFQFALANQLLPLEQVKNLYEEQA